MPAPTRFSLRDNVSEDARTNRAPKRDEADRVAANAPIPVRHESRRDRLQATQAFPLRARSDGRRRVRRLQEMSKMSLPCLVLFAYFDEPFRTVLPHCLE